MFAGWCDTGVAPVMGNRKIRMVNQSDPRPEKFTPRGGCGYSSQTNHSRESPKRFIQPVQKIRHWACHWLHRCIVASQPSPPKPGQAWSSLLKPATGTTTATSTVVLCSVVLRRGFGCGWVCYLWISIVSMLCLRLSLVVAVLTCLLLFFVVVF